MGREFLLKKEFLLRKNKLEVAVKKGYKTCELSVITESNQKMKGLVEALGFQKVKKYRIYSRKLDPPGYQPEVSRTIRL